MKELLRLNGNKISYFSECQGEKNGHFYEMKIHIGNEIAKIQKARGKSNDEMANAIGTSVRNWSHLKNRDDLAVSQLHRISEILDYNFFALFEPVVKQKSQVEEIKVTYDRNTPRYTVNFQIRYPAPLVEQLGNFMAHVHALAKKYGYEIV